MNKIIIPSVSNIRKKKDCLKVKKCQTIISAGQGIEISEHNCEYKISTLTSNYFNKTNLEGSVTISSDTEINTISTSNNTLNTLRIDMYMLRNNTPAWEYYKFNYSILNNILTIYPFSLKYNNGEFEVEVMLVPSGNNVSIYLVTSILTKINYYVEIISSPM